MSKQIVSKSNFDCNDMNSASADVNRYYSVDPAVI